MRNRNNLYEYELLCCVFLSMYDIFFCRFIFEVSEVVTLINRIHIYLFTRFVSENF